MARGRFRRRGTAPNLLCICIEEIQDGEIRGEVHSRYSETPWQFHSLLELLGGMESFFNRISFPQSAVQLRGMEWIRPDSLPDAADTPILEREALLENKGSCGTFLVTVRYRQNATWQGNFLWLEENRSIDFKSALELLLMLDKAIKYKSGRNYFSNNW